MIRTLLILSVASAALSLAACDKPSALTKAQPGECYQVVGKDSLGAPTFAKTACAADAAAGNVQTATADTTAAGVCPRTPVCTGVGSGAGTGSSTATGGSSTASASGAPAYVATSAVRHSKAAGRRSAHSRNKGSHASSRYAKSESGDYARVTDSDYYTGGSTRKAGGSSGESTDYSNRNSGGRVQGGSYSQSGSSSSAEYASRDSARSGYSVQSSGSEQSSSSYSETSSSSGSGYAYSYSSGSGHGLAGGACNCGGGRPAPGPHSPFDGNGFLTWQGKVQYDPRR